MSIQEQIEHDSNEALKDANMPRREFLSTVLARLKTKAIQLRVDKLDDTAAIEVLKKERSELEEAAEFARKITDEQKMGKILFDNGYRQGVLGKYLPSAPGTEEVRKEVEKAIAAVGATSMRDMGKVIALVVAALPAADKKDISGIAKSLLTG